MFIILYSYAAYSGRLVDSYSSLLEILLFLWGISLALVEVKQMRAAPTFRDYMEDLWNILDCLHISTLLCTQIATLVLGDRHAEKGDWDTVLENLHSINLLPSW